jgi:SAM-dependent methyltransferase
MSEQFDADWLDQREPYDARARNATLALRLAAALPARPRLLDLGAGTGSLLRWLGHYIARAQAWTLVDADAALLERAFATIAERAEQVGWTVTWPAKKTLLVHAPSGAWRVEGLVADLREAPANLPLDRVDAVVNTALCDLVARDWVARMAAACAARRLPFYAALNVNGRERFSPPHRADAWIARGFRRDQARDKGFGGTALGPLAPQAIADAFAAQGYTVQRAGADWLVPPRDADMADAIALGHWRAAQRHERRAARLMARWSLVRMLQAQRRRLGVRIGHTDVLALPPG